MLGSSTEGGCLLCPPPPPSSSSALDPQGSPCLERPSPWSRQPWRHSRLCSDPVSAVCLSAHPSSSCQPSAPASQKPHPCGSERVGWGAPPETELPAVKEAGGGLHISSRRAVSSDCLSECPDHQGSMAARSHVIKDQVSLKTRPCRSLRPRLQRQRTCRPSSETPGHPVSGKRGRRGQRAHLGRALPLQARQCTPPGGAPASPFLSQPPLPVTPSGSATSLLHFSPLYSSVLTPSSLQKLTHCNHSDVNPPSYASSDLRTSTPTSTCCIIIGMLSGLARRLWHRAGPVFSRFRGAPRGVRCGGGSTSHAGTWFIHRSYSRSHRGLGGL